MDETRINMSEQIITNNLSDSDGNNLPLHFNLLNNLFTDVIEKARENYMASNSQPVIPLSSAPKRLEVVDVDHLNGREGPPPAKMPKISASTPNIPVITIAEESDNDKDNSLGQRNLTFQNSQLREPEIINVQPEVELVPLRFRWKQEVFEFKVPSMTRLCTLRMEIAKRIALRPDDLVILDENNSDADNTIAESVAVDETFDVFERDASDEHSDPHFVLIQLQGCGGYRSRCCFAIKKTTHVNQLVEDYIHKYQFHGKQFKLVFDGETVDLRETPNSLDLENNDMLDIVEIASPSNSSNIPVITISEESDSENDSPPSPLDMLQIVEL